MGTTPSIVDVRPAPDATGIVVGDQIQVTFDQEMDESSINTGTFLLVAPDTGVNFFGPAATPFDEPGLDEEDILSSPYYGGFVKGTISFSNVQTGGPATIAIFTPEQPLSANKEYSAIISGDEDLDDGLDTGVMTRTVFDAVEVSVSGSGTPVFSGGYTGDSSRVYHLEITAGGPTGDAEYQWWEESDPLTVFQGITTTGYREFQDGLLVSFDHDGTFDVGDEWTVNCEPGVLLPNNYKWTFRTGSGSILVPPSTHSTTGIVEAEGELEIVSITPKDKATHLDPTSVSEIVIVFNKPIDEATVTDDTISVWSEPVNGDTNNSNIEYTGNIAKVLSVEGNILTIQIS